MSNELKKTVIKRMIIASPIAIGLGIWGALKFVEFVGLNLSKTELIFGTFIGIIGCCSAMYRGFKKHFDSHE